ncbi:hypothetical protein D0T12_21585 [Actinomadura spongiicola]|uniref:Uncharacterized protein n=1 Tax=Actinomadura spongiicola TaxID=2303421 RepID=A0A372GE13_9ACTN|nr:hypothetical protein [Actinomadura spongiicola]RFS83614.1 hypothetical protein D0T12_21585 [Actinomadura spongiicola]
MPSNQVPHLRVLPETREFALELVAEGKIFKAVSLVHKATGADRKHAKAYVEVLRAEVLARHVPVEVERAAIALVAKGKPVDATKLIVLNTDLNLKDGHRYMDALRSGRLSAR